jgi:hypothetical protein
MRIQDARQQDTRPKNPTISLPKRSITKKLDEF